MLAVALATVAASALMTYGAYRYTVHLTKQKWSTNKVTDFENYWRLKNAIERWERNVKRSAWSTALLLWFPIIVFFL